MIIWRDPLRREPVFLVNRGTSIQGIPTEEEKESERHFLCPSDHFAVQANITLLAPKPKGGGGDSDTTTPLLVVAAVLCFLLVCGLGFYFCYHRIREAKKQDHLESQLLRSRGARQSYSSGFLDNAQDLLESDLDEDQFNLGVQG